MGFGGKKRELKRKSTSSVEFKAPTRPPKRRSYAGHTQHTIAEGPSSILKPAKNFLTSAHFSETDQNSVRSSFLNYLPLLDASHKNLATSPCQSEKHTDLDVSVRKHFYKTLLPSLSTNISVLRENDRNHRDFLEKVLALPWDQGGDAECKEGPCLEAVSNFLVEVVSYKPAFKVKIMECLVRRIVKFTEPKMELWFHQVVARFAARDPMISSEFVGCLKSSFPAISTAIRSPAGYATYIRIGLNFCVERMPDTSEKCALFNHFLTQLIKIDALLPTPIDLVENPQHKVMVELIDAGLCEFLNVVVRHNPLEVVKQTVYEQILMKSMDSTFCGTIFFVSATYQPKMLVKYVFQKLLGEDVLVARRSMMVLAGLLGHCQRIGRVYLQFILKKLVQWCFQYIRKVESKAGANALSFSKNTSTAVEKHGHFYAAVQCILQTTVLRQGCIFQNHETQQFQSLNLNHVLFNRLLNPLLFCPHSTLLQYNRLMKHLHLTQISSKMDQNTEIQAMETLGSHSQIREMHWNPLNWHDPFHASTIAHLSETRERFMKDIMVEYVDIVKAGEDLMKEYDSGITQPANSVEDSGSDSSSDSSGSSEFDEMEVEEMSVLARIMRRERTISEKSI